MKIPQDGCLLRIFIGESDKWQNLPGVIIGKIKRPG